MASRGVGNATPRSVRDQPPSGSTPDTVSKMQQMPSTTDPVTRRDYPSQLLTIPIELHDHIAIFLSTRSILNLIMVNRYLRPIYEAILYRCINLRSLPNRSIGLLETFKLRPDLALLVHTLNIDLRPSVVGTTASQSIQSAATSPGGYARIRAFGLAKNIRSLGISGLSWVPDERFNAIQEVVSTMELRTLRIMEPRPTSDVHHLEHKEEVVANLRRVLQAQPLLTDLDLEFRLFKMEVKNGGNVQFDIQRSDVPSLRTLGIRASTIVPLLTAIDGGQLETLYIYEWKLQHHNTLVSSFSQLAETSQKIRKLCLSMRWTLNLSFWGFDFGQVLKLFPNLESLTITAILTPLLTQHPKHLDANFERLAAQIHHSPKILKIELNLQVSAKPRKVHLGDVSEEFKLRLKGSCPSLQTFVDPTRQEWEFFPVEGEGGGKAFRVVKIGRLQPAVGYFATTDRPFPEQDV